MNFVLPPKRELPPGTEVLHEKLLLKLVNLFLYNILKYILIFKILDETICLCDAVIMLQFVLNITYD